MIDNCKGMVKESMGTGNNKNILVTGHTGMVGSSIIKKLEEHNYHNVIKFSHSELDLVKQADVEKVFEEYSPEIVIHAAAKMGSSKSYETHPASFLAENMQMNTNILNAAIKFGCEVFLNFSSSWVYEDSQYGIITENFPLCSNYQLHNTPYILPKIFSMKLCEYMKVEYNIDYINVIPTNIYGSGDNYEAESSHVLPSFIRRFDEAKRKGLKEITCWGNGSPIRDFIFSEDAAEACLCLMENKFVGNVNLCSGTSISIKELATLVAGVIGYEGRILWESEDDNSAKGFILDNKVLRDFGWYSSVDLTSGIKVCYNDYLSRFFKQH